MESDKRRKKNWDDPDPERLELEKRKAELQELQRRLYEKSRRPRFGINMRVTNSTIELLDKLAFTLRLDKRIIVERALAHFAEGRKLETPTEEWYESHYKSKIPPYKEREK